MYLKNVSAELDRRTAHFYQHDPLNTQDSLRRLEPGEAATYTVGWQFAEQSLRNPDKQKVVVQVETIEESVFSRCANQSGDRYSGVAIVRSHLWAASPV